MILVLGMVVQARNQSVVSGLITLEGQLTIIEVMHENKPMVRLQGELWAVQCDSPLEPGDSVRITEAKGVVLGVEQEQENTT